MARRSRCNHLSVDDFYFSALLDEEEIFPISDEKYAVELQLQEALMVSAASSRTIRTPSSEMQDHKIKIQRGKREIGESSQSFCRICMDAKPAQELFRNNSFTHSFCSDCIGKHVAVKIQENISMVECPELNCKGALQLEFCRPILPQEVLIDGKMHFVNNWFLGSQKFYCPFKDCSAILVDDGGEAVTSSECPNCRRLFCAQCKVSWHGGIECREFQRLKKGEREREDIMVMELAKIKKWRRCPNCKFYVEKLDGCLHISCRCGFQFCYWCGSKWTPPHGCPQS